MRFSLTLLCLLAALAARAGASQKLEVFPARVTLRLGEGKQLRARLNGKDAEVRWTVDSAAAGSVTAGGFYQAPPAATTPATFHITATAAADPALRAEALVFVEAVGVKVSPEQIETAPGQTAQLRAAIGGTADQRVRWSVDGGAANGSISESGLYSAPGHFLTPGSVTVRATSVADPSKSDTTTLHFGPVSITVAPEEVTLQHGQTRRFATKVAGTENTGVEWKVLGENQGEVTTTGLYIPPPTMVTPCVVTVVAASAADPSKTATARIRIPAIQIGPGKGKKNRRGGLADTAGRIMRGAVSRVSRIYLPFNPLDVMVMGPIFRDKAGKQYLPLGGSIALDAAVTNSTDDRVRWELEGLKLGRLTEDGFYQAPAKLTTPQVVQVRATSLADTTKSVVYTLHIPPVIVQPKQEAYTCKLGAAVQLAADANNTEDDHLVWSVQGGEALGTISEAGLYHPPAALTTPAQVRIRAASAADPTKFALIQVNVPEAGIDVSPGTAEVKPGQTVRLKARLKGCDPASEVVWKVTPEVGSISPDGVYRAPESGPQVVQVSACLKADPTKVVTATIRVR